MSENTFPRLNDRARGWLRFIWDKATTQDDWSSAGTPHPWWDRYSTAPFCTFPRWDLHETGYVLPVMCDVTPAWREVYTRIADELVGRDTTFWAAIDWLTMVGHDPGADRYPPEWLFYLPEHLRGRYDAPGWTANGVAPWGLQPDPIGADGNNFYRGFFNLLLCFYDYVCNDQKWAKPFKVAGYQDRLYEWDRHRLAQFIHDQWAERPAGVHCENTKIWPFCVSGAGLSLKMYDNLYQTDTNYLFGNWVEYARKHYMKLNKRGEMEWFAFFYDPLEKTVFRLYDEMSAYASLCITPYVYPQHKELGTLLYETSVRQLGWNDPKKPVFEFHPDPRWGLIGLLMARELGDHETEDRLRTLAEREYEPRFFGENADYFGWWFHNGEEWPRGQLAALAMLCEVGAPGAWTRVFDQPNLRKFDEPTLEGVAFPQLGVAQAWNDSAAGALWVETYAATSSVRGSKTTWRVSQLPDPAGVTVVCDGSDFSAFRAIDANSIEIDTDIDDHLFRINTGYHGDARQSPANQASVKKRPGAPVRSLYVPAAPGGTSCCG
jgi:hypothetical protein